VRKFLFPFVIALVVAFQATAAEPVPVTLTDGATLSGEIIKVDDNGLMLRLAGETYATTNVVWSRLSQDTLKRLVENPKIRPLAEVFIEPDESQRPAKAEVKVNTDITRLARPENPSLSGGLFGSLLGKVILLLVYLASLYAAYEVSIIRARPALQVVGLSAVLPILGPIIFLIMPVRIEKTPEPEAGTAAAGEVGQAAAEIQIVEASWKQPEEKKIEPQVFSRGKFTFNKRFVETKFANYVGAPKGDALKFAMEVKTSTANFAVEHIAQVAMTDVIFETPNGQVSMPLTDIQEIKLTPKSA
jgi:hypothetical protein